MPRSRTPAPPPPAGASRRTWLAGGAAVALAGVLVYALFFWPSEEEKVIEVVLDFCHAVRVSGPNENPAIRRLRLEGDLGDLLVAEARAEIPELQAGIHGRREIATLATAAATQWATAAVSLDAIQAKVDAAKTTATVRATATLNATEHGGAPRRDTRQVTFTLDKIDGRWWIVSVAVPPKQGAEPVGADV
jgi:ketosteroid isomerase-like protein